MTSAFMQQLPGSVTVHPPTEFYIGDTWEIAASCADGDGLPIDLTAAASIRWSLCNSSRVNVFVLTVGDGIVLFEDTSGEAITGRLMIELSDDRSKTLQPGFYFDELTVETASGKTLTQFKGRIEALAKLPGGVSGG